MPVTCFEKKNLTMVNHAMIISRFAFEDVTEILTVAKYSSTCVVWFHHSLIILLHFTRAAVAFYAQFKVIVLTYKALRHS